MNRDDIEPEDLPLAEAIASLKRTIPSDVEAKHLARIRDEARRVTPLRRRRSRVLVLTLAATLLVVPMAGGALAADGSVPGDTLYGLDRAVESVRLAAARTPDSRARVRLEQVAERLVEIAELERRGDTARVETTAQVAARTTAAALDESDDQGVRKNAERHLTKLAAVRDKLAAKGNDNAAAALTRAIDKQRSKMTGDSPRKSPRPEKSPKPEKSPRPEKSPKPEKSPRAERSPDVDDDDDEREPRGRPENPGEQGRGRSK